MCKPCWMWQRQKFARNKQTEDVSVRTCIRWKQVKESEERMQQDWFHSATAWLSRDKKAKNKARNCADDLSAQGDTKSLHTSTHAHTSKASVAWWQQKRIKLASRSAKSGQSVWKSCWSCEASRSRLKSRWVFALNSIGRATGQASYLTWKAEHHSHLSLRRMSFWYRVWDRLATIHAI